MNFQLFKYRLIKTKPKCSNNSSSLTQVKYKIFMLRVSNQLSQVLLRHKQMETPLEKKVRIQTQLNNKTQVNNSLMLQQVPMDKLDKLPKVWKTELKVPRHTLNQSIKNLKKMNLIENRLGIFFNIKCRSWTYQEQNRNWSSRIFFIRKLNWIEKWERRYRLEISNHFQLLEEALLEKSEFVDILKLEK